MTKETAPPATTRDQILEAALEALKQQGFSGATSRVIARAGGFNQALIFYHFGTLESLLLAALDRTSERRLARYRQVVAEAHSLEDLAAAVRRIYDEDREQGHITVVSQMIAGSVARPELAREMVVRMEPWIELCEEALEKALGWIDAPKLVPPRELAYAFVTFYLGVNLLTHLDADRTRTDALFARVEQLAPLLGGLATKRA